MEKAANDVSISTEKDPVKQQSPAEYLSGDREDLPLWLKEYKEGEKVCIKDLLKSRIVYNPGAGTEGSPIRTFNAAHAAHVFVYVDYGFEKDEIDRALSNDAFLGYHIIHEQTVSVNEFPTPVYHLTAEEKAEIIQRYTMARVPTQNSFGILKLYQRNEGFGEDHGAWRFAILYLGADAVAAYDALFGNTNCTPFACVVDAYGFCGEYDHFARNSFLARIAQRTNRLPPYLLCAHHCGGWDGYIMLKTVGGTRGRFLWKKEEQKE